MKTVYAFLADTVQYAGRYGKEPEQFLKEFQVFLNDTKN